MRAIANRLATDRPGARQNDCSCVILTIGGGINWQGENYTTSINPITDAPARLEQDAYTLVDLMARYEFSEMLSAQLNVDNLLDEAYYSQISFYNQLAFGEPRNVSLHVRYAF